MSHTHSQPPGAARQSMHPATPPPPPGWMLADPVCSMAITILIVVSVYPLMKDSLETLMMRTPPTIEHYLPGAYQKVKTAVLNMDSWAHGWGRGGGGAVVCLSVADH